MCLEISSCCYHHENIFYSCMSNEWPCIESRVIKTYTHTAAIASAAKTRRNWKGPAANLILKHASFASEHVTLDKRLQKWVESLRNCWHSITKKCHGCCHLFQKPSALQWKRVRRKCMQEMVGQERRKDIKKLHKFYQYANQKNTL